MTIANVNNLYLFYLSLRFGITALLYCVFSIEIP